MTHSILSAGMHFMGPSRLFRRRDGLTLVEGFLTTIISVIVISILYELTATSRDVSATLSAQGVLQMELSRAVDSLSRDLRLAIRAPAAHNAYTRSATTVILEVPSVNAAGRVIDIANHVDYFVYSFDAASGVLQRIVDAKDGVSSRTDETRVIARYLSGVTFPFPPPAQEQDVTFTLTGSRVEKGRTHTETLTGRGRFRNA